MHFNYGLIRKDSATTVLYYAQVQRRLKKTLNSLLLRLVLMISLFCKATMAEGHGCC